MYPSPLSGFWLVLNIHLGRSPSNHSDGYAFRTIAQPESFNPYPKFRILMQYAGKWTDFPLAWRAEAALFASSARYAPGRNLNVALC